MTSFDECLIPADQKCASNTQRRSRAECGEKFVRKTVKFRELKDPGEHNVPAVFLSSQKELPADNGPRQAYRKAPALSEKARHFSMLRGRPPEFDHRSSHTGSALIAFVVAWVCRQDGLRSPSNCSCWKTFSRRPKRCAPRLGVVRFL